MLIRKLTNMLIRSSLLLVLFAASCGANGATSTVMPSLSVPAPQSSPVQPSRPPSTKTSQPTQTKISQPAPAAKAGIPFPRLGMWWPNPWEQSLDHIARYDWVILGDYEAEFIDEIRIRNPDILLLTSSNACELGYDPEGDEEYNAEVLKIPPEWFLTQVGTTLTEDVDSTTTTFHVAAVTASDDSDTYSLFVAGDTALIEGESVFVEAVNEAANTITVQRGFVRPAAAHNAGTRIAAHITFWPNSWLLNLSTMSPTAVISDTIGAERWGDYNARVGINMVASADWDGLLIDRSDPNQSWLIGNSTARTIDPDQSNTLLTDYTGFDASWNEGLRLYEEALRTGVGADKIIFPNWGMNNYDLLNGNNYEGFPTDEGLSYASGWSETVFGPLPDVGSYFEWIAKGQQPNLTMVETYEDDGSPDATGNGEYDNPCDDPDFVPNYQKMRFGLGTALLNDGYFSYEINTNGHGSLCLLWFDEYDNAGQGRGYLGMPLGDAYRTGNPAMGSNLLSGGGFESQEDLENWDLWADESEGYTATLTLDTSTAAEGNSSARVNVTQSQGTDWQVSFSFEPMEVISGTEYTLTFWAKADQVRTISAWVQQASEPWEDYIDFGSVALTTDWQQFEVSGIATGDNPAASFYFGLGSTTGSVWLDDVHLQSGSREIWRRDYEHGIALVNATHNPQTIPLGGIFRKIAGTQVPQVNNGELVSEVILNPLDGLIVLREQQTYLPLVTRIAAAGY